jgi:uncharacterized membrane protein (DUF485 family)
VDHQIVTTPSRRDHPDPGGALAPGPSPEGRGDNAAARAFGGTSGAAWPRIAASPQFRGLLRAKRRFIIPATIIFIVYYFALPVLVGYFPAFMERDVIGQFNLAYLFALSQFFMAWIIMWLYIRAARRFDRMEHEIAAGIDRPDPATAAPSDQETKRQRDGETK